jgi:hypothetical protein
MSDLIPCLAVTGSLALIFGLLAFLRYLNYRKTIALAEKGLSRPERKSGGSLLRWGILITALGLALSLGLYPIGLSTGYDYPLHLGPWMLGGLIPLFLGLGLLLLHVLTSKN